MFVLAKKQRCLFALIRLFGMFNYLRKWLSLKERKISHQFKLHFSVEVVAMVCSQRRHFEASFLKSGFWQVWLPLP